MKRGLIAFIGGAMLVFAGLLFRVPQAEPYFSRSPSQGLSGTCSS